jgi:hypothetical protein
MRWLYSAASLYKRHSENFLRARIDERQSEASIKTESGTARKRRGPIPIDWVQGVAYLDPDRPPNDVPRHRWRQFVGDCKNFLSSSENWANRATRLGWDAMAPN